MGLAAAGACKTSLPAVRQAPRFPRGYPPGVGLVRNRGDPGAMRQGRAMAGDVKAALKLEQAWRRYGESHGGVFRRELWRLGPGRTGKRRLEQRGRRLRLLEVRPGWDRKVAEIGEDKIRNLRPVRDGVGQGVQVPLLRLGRRCRPLGGRGHYMDDAIAARFQCFENPRQSGNGARLNIVK